MDGIIYKAHFLSASLPLFEHLLVAVDWDQSMRARKTASFGVAYNYSQIHYPDQPMPSALLKVADSIHQQIGFMPNNCLLNLYLDGNSKMGYHSDQTDILQAGTGVAIVSLGATRILRFRKINRKEEKIDYELSSGSLLYMNQLVQSNWQHAIPKSTTVQPRMSLTFRKIKD